MRFSVHAPWQANPLKTGGVEAIEESLLFARDIGAALVNFHLYPEGGAQRYFEACRPVFERAAELNLALSLENTPETAPQDFNDFFALVAHSPFRDRVGMCLDIGHANCCAATRNDFIRFIDTLTDDVRIIHCHVHENWGDRDAHLTLFTGPAKEHPGGVDAFLERLRRRDFCGILVLEQFPEPRELLTQAEQRLRERSGCPRHSNPVEAAAFLAASTPAAPGAGVAPAPTVTPPAQAPQAQAPLAGQVEASAGLPAIAPSEDHESEFDASTVSNPFGAALVEASREHVSWRRRLYWVLEQLLSAEFEASEENLACIAVYLRFLGTGELPCREDGGHYRPNHHARAAAEMERALLHLRTPENAWLLRRILPWLPAYGEEFQRHEPLTRIRDIAHRNDIPRELKLRIKHDLQNKLHRSAGPEDLQTAADILQTITAPGATYAPAFVAEFRIFYAELQEFFNAPGLQARLQRLLPACPVLTGAVQSFQNAAAQGDPQQKTVCALRLREQLQTLLCDEHSVCDPAVQEVAAEEPCAAPAPAVRQSIRIADIELEDAGFAALAALGNRVEGEAAIGAGWFAGVDAALGHLALSGTEREEAQVLRGEFASWADGFDLRERFQALRLKASVERARRICENHTRKVAAYFTPAVLELGAAFHLDRAQLEVFVEADIRANVVFQLSRLLSCALQRIRESQHLPPWDVIVPGTARGMLVQAATLEEAAGRAEADGIIAALDEASGDEEIPAGVRAILVAHPLPHLSHLAVRARQAGVCFAAADADAAFASLKALAGQPACVRCGSDQVTIDKASGGALDGAPKDGPRPPEQARAAAAELTLEQAVLEIAQARPETCGAKAVGAHQLIGLALASGGLFSAPRALAIPFGVLEAALRAETGCEAYEALRRTVDDLDGAEFDGALRKLRQMICSLPVPAEIGGRVCAYFGEQTRIAVRSSSNAEDLAGLAGAGLYDSIVGVRAIEADAAIRAVWASLWTRRAAQSRRQYRIPHEQAHMAVLVQEMVEPEYSFVLHTADPVTGEHGRVGMEIAAGLGETLVSADQPGQPWRLSTGEGEPPLLHACASFSFQRQPSDREGVSDIRLDYSQVRLSREMGALEELATRLAQAGRFIARERGCPQDIEGVVTGDCIYIVQTRPQAGLPGV